MRSNKARKFSTTMTSSLFPAFGESRNDLQHPDEELDEAEETGAAEEADVAACSIKNKIENLDTEDETFPRNSFFTKDIKNKLMSLSELNQEPILWNFYK